MAPNPKTHYDVTISSRTATKTVKPSKKVVPKPAPTPTCYIMPDGAKIKDGQVIVSTSKVKDGCYVLVFQDQRSTMLVAEGDQWYEYSKELLQVNLAFELLFGVLLLIVLWFRGAK